MKGLLNQPEMNPQAELAQVDEFNQSSKGHCKFAAIGSLICYDL